MTTAEMLILRLRSSRFFNVLCSVSATILFDIDGEVFVASTGGDRFQMRGADVADGHDVDIVVNIERTWLESANPSGRASIQNAGGIQRVHPTFERVLLRCLSDLDAVSCHDLNELFYSPIFEFGDPRVVWTSPSSAVSVLRFSWPSKSCEAVVTSGLHSIICSRPFELVLLLAPSAGERLQMELIGWTRYVLERKASFRAGEWLEYEEGSIPDTRFSGFLLLPPVLLPRQVPAEKGTAELLLFLPVTGAELARAKTTTSFEVAQELFEDGVRDIRS